MDKKFSLTHNGQQVQRDDIDTIGEAAGLADDRTLASLIGVAPLFGSTVSRGVLRHSPFGDVTGLVSPGIGEVYVNPFRAFVGSRTSATTDMLAWVRDIRSTFSVAEGETDTTTVPIAANSSGSPRWDLVYAAVAVDANGPSVLRKVKDPASKLVSEQSVAVTKSTTIAFGVVAGTPAATPTRPAIPSDSGLTYYIPLAYVRVPDGFSASSTILSTDIVDIAPHLSLTLGAGCRAMRPATVNSSPSSTLLDSWGSSGTRPSIYMPAGMTGSESLMVAIKTSEMNDGDVIDAGANWGQRVCRYTGVVGFESSFPWQGTDGAPAAFTNKPSLVATSNRVQHGLGQTFVEDSAGKAFVALLMGNEVASISDTDFVGIYYDLATNELKLRKAGTIASITIFFWIDFSAQFPNL